MNSDLEKQDVPFVFLGEVLALDFVNTEVVVRNKRADLLRQCDDLAAWRNSALEHYPDLPAVVDCDPQTFDAAKRLRAALRRLFTAVAEGYRPQVTDIHAVNQVLRSGHSALNVTSEGYFTAIYRSDENIDWLLAIALSTLSLLTEGDLARLHKCKNERCILLFYDTTKSATRRWCSTECMNRARSIEHYRKSRA